MLTASQPAQSGLRVANAHGHPRAERLGAGLMVASVLVLALAGLRPLSDPDLWWHLRSGEDVLGTGHFVSSAQLTTGQDSQWIKHEWASDAAFALVHRAGGLDAVIVLHVCLLALIGISIAAVARRQGSSLHAAIGTLLCVAAVVPYASERPQLISFALLPLLAHQLVSAARTGRPPWLLVPMIWVWSCFHGLWLVGAGCYGAFVLLLAIERRHQLKSVVPFAGVAVAVAAIVNLTPLGWHVYEAPLEIARVTQYIAEWRRPSPEHHPWLVLPLVLAIIVALAWWRQRHVTLTHLAVFVPAIILGASYVRGLPVAALLLLPLAVAALPSLSSAVEYVPSGVRRDRNLVVAGAIASLLAIMTVLATPMPNVRHPYSAAIAAIRAMGDGQRILTEDTLGSRLLWFAPAARPSIDGRLELYPAAYLEQYQRLMSAQAGWQSVVRDGMWDAAWLHRDLPLTDRLRSHLGWRVVAVDGSTVLLAPRSGRHLPEKGA